MKKTYSTLLLVTGFMALMLVLPFAHLNAEPAGNPNNSAVSLTSNVNQSDIPGFNQLESPLLMAQMTEEHRFSESSSSTMRSTTTETQPAVQHDCVGHCRDHYKQSLVECNEPGHPKHDKCDKWAREREQECLNLCSRE